MTKEEILKLSELGREEQVEWLKDNEVLEWRGAYAYSFRDPERVVVWESFPDMAFRLRCECSHSEWRGGCYALCDSIELAFNRWEFEAEPIHWIQAALLARLEEK